MFTARIKPKDFQDGVLVLKSNQRSAMRNLEFLCRENDVFCETTVEVTPRVVKFKGIEPSLAAAAKADAKADMKAAGKGK